MSFGISSVDGPLSVIAKIKEEDWPRAIVMLALYLEKHSYLAAKEYLEPLKSKIDNEYWKAIEEHLEAKLHLLDYGLILLTVGKIDSGEFHTMKRINTVRNKWIHRREKYGYRIGSQGKKEYLPLLEKGEELLQKLFTTHIYISRR